MRLFSRLILAASLLALPLSAAAVGISVRDLKAEVKNGTVMLTWTAPESSANVARYRAYYARRSILENQGDYDEYETTKGTETSLTLNTLPRTTAMYVAVLPVGKDGKELAKFTDEVHVDLSSITPPSSSSATSLELLSARTSSATEITLAFSAAPGVSAVDAQRAFTVTDANSTTLGLTHLLFQDNDVVITTAAQRPGTTYTVRVSPSVYGSVAAGRVSLNPARASATFTTSGTAPALQQGLPPDVKNLQVKGEEGQNGLYLLIAVWDVPQDPSITGIRVRQTRDGTMYGLPQDLPPTATSVRLQNVQPGRFGLLIQTVSAGGLQSVGSTALGTLGSSIVTRQPVPPPTPRSTPRQNALPSSGPAELSIIALSGGVAGWFKMRRRGGK